MNPVEVFGKMYDDARAELGTFGGFGSRFDDENLVPRDAVADAINTIGELSVDAPTVERWAEQRWFHWRPLPGAETGVQFGVPVYVIDRLVMFEGLAREGWTDAELTAYAEFEDAWVETIVLDEHVPMLQDHDEGLAAVKAMVEIDYAALTNEAIIRRPADDRPEDWFGGSRSGALADLSDDRFRTRLERVARLRESLNESGWRGVSQTLAEALRRRAYIGAHWEEMVNVCLLEGERRPLRLGVSWFVAPADTFMRGPMSFAEALGVGDAGPWLESFQPDWKSTLRRPWTDDDGVELPIRLPGVILNEGRPMLTGAANPTAYAEIYRRWEIGSYIERHAEMVGARRCPHCHAPVAGAAKKVYCSTECSHAARQARVREKQQEANGARNRQTEPDRDGGR